MSTVSATELARHTSEVLDKVAGQREIVDVERNRMIIARIIPAESPRTVRQVLANFTFPILTPEEGRSWLEDSKGGEFGEEIIDPWINHP
jgi:antitoxin (DNA-binding transcriptional repressor) of toxin-antitoxin stability system